MIFRPAESSKNIVDFYKRYLLTTFQTTNEKYNKQLEEELNKKDAIYKGPYISLTDAFEKGKTIEELVNEHILVKSFINFEKLKPSRKLYKHQETAIRKAKEKKNLIITTGTGSGKTECFLIPVINRLLEEEEKGTLDAGVRTLLIYPMNALVNDQILRLRDIFSSNPYSNITFGRYTGETEEEYGDALAKYKNLYKDPITKEPLLPIKNELISRDQMRTTPPNILITNYAMLEYLLLRPDDNVFFSENYAPKWQFIIFDEAHTYEGAKGIEVGALIRRLKATLNNQNINFILTSATLGDKNDDKKITAFGKSLCDTDFEEASIIRSNTIAPQLPDKYNDIDFSIYTNLAIMIRENTSFDEMIEYLKEHNIKIYTESNSENTFSKTLYNMILQDSFYTKVRKTLSKTIELKNAAKELNLNENEFTDFITVASNANLNGDKLFDAKYHMFLKGIEGVYITLKPSEKLFINKRETYKESVFSSDEDSFKVFEISFCNNCNTTFIIGQTEEREGINYLVQKSKFNEDYCPEIYMLDECNIDLDLEDNEEDNEDNACLKPKKGTHDAEKEYIICPQCGAIQKKSALKRLCEHDSKNYQTIIKVNNEGDIMHTCPSCGTFNAKRSIIRPYIAGNEAITAVVATSLYNELPSEIVHKTKVQIDNSFFGDSSYIEKETKNLTKQFLAFSDSRQAAAFFASYLDTTYKINLFKRLMSEVAQIHKDDIFKGLSITRFKDYLVNLFEKYNIFSHTYSGTELKDIREKEAYIAIFNEITNLKAKSSLQNKGILFFDFDIDMKNDAKPLGLNAEEITILFKILLSEFLKYRAVKFPIGITESDKERLLFGGKIISFSENPCSKKNVKPWITKTDNSKRKKFIKTLIPNISTEEILQQVWTFFIKNEYILSYENYCYLANFNKIIVKPIEHLYICQNCKTITPYNLRDICPKCLGTLKDYDYEKDLENNHYYKLFKDLKICDLVAKEHTAQLGQDLAYEYQNEFVNKQINVLSCSTTFEMGVDVGSLETVFMRNMPPTPANYVQRAGRAGRSTHSAAYALTFCPNNSHDLNYYRNPEEMIAGKINPPSFDINNEKILLRHIFACAFSTFWKKNPQFYTKHIGDFFDMYGFEKFEKYLQTNPQDLKEYLLRAISNNDIIEKYQIHTFGWVNKLYNNEKNSLGVFNIAKIRYIEKIKELENAKKEKEGIYKKESKYHYEVAKIERSIELLKDQQTIEFLSSNNLIPKYGFPVDTVELLGGKDSDLTNLRLNRDLFTAISEYAPEGEVIADGKLIKSRYVKKLEGYEWPRHNYKICDCGTLNIDNAGHGEIIKCKQCGKDLSNVGYKQFVIPKFGFLAANEPPKLAGTEKPVRTYRGQIFYVGNPNSIITKKHFLINNNQEVEIVSSKMDELAVLNTSNFYICNDCGYTIIKESVKDFIEQEHENPSGYKCRQQLQKLHIGHEFQTDVVSIKFLNKKFEENEAWSILYALLEGLSKYIPVDRKELSGCLNWSDGNRELILFDNTPGGAGYVRQLMNSFVFQEMLKNAQKVVVQCKCGGDEGEGACYGCLCNYYNQRQHDDLKRKYAIDFFNKLLCAKNDFYVEEMELFDASKESNDEYSPAIFKEGSGKHFGNMTYKQIVDYVDDENFAEILKEDNIEEFEKPYYNSSITTIKNNKEINALLIWKVSKVLLFDDEKEYNKSLQTDWKAFLLNSEFQVEKLVKELKKENK